MMRLPKPRLRTIDAVAIAAAALLALKLLDLAAGGQQPVPAGTEPSARDELPPFARALARARQNPNYADVSTTGDIAPKPAKGEDQEAPNSAPSPPQSAPGSSSSAPAQQTEAAPVPSPSERTLLERLGERRNVLERRDRDMDVRERLIENAEKRLEGRIEELRSLESAGEQKRNEADGALKGVVTMYEAMKPKDAARVFDRLPLEILVPLVLKMNPRKMAEVLAVMQADAAEKLTVALATRGKTPDPAPRPQAAATEASGNELPGIEAAAGPDRKQP